ncbi:hypothetical protein [Nakamurella sp. PAMC28650]|uniref:hypothetical protein n=1 Tax=Nakamurella sp. PAMC28650 TaxID=2762325 RepID=UPI00164DB820|nr:hypothetical protein [Nakamurella sp. PAMC28650]QNK81553.1 hypothetical protein H7F38_01525 [Nakamurella sp. PAMC28650]
MLTISPILSGDSTWGSKSGKYRAAQGAAEAAPVEEELTETERAELARLRRRIAEQDRKLQDQAEDVAFLKKASAYFAAMQPK